MFGLDAVTLGITLGIAALALIGLVALLLRAAPTPPLATQKPVEVPASALRLEEHTEATMLVAGGGKIVYMNHTLREWFGLGADDLPNLEFLSRRTRPGNTLLSLCATQGQARFSVQGKLVDGTSYLVPYKNESAMLVAFRAPDLSLITQSENTVSGNTFGILAGMSQSMTASLELEPTLQAIMNSIDSLVPAEISEINVWDDAQKNLIPYMFFGMPGVERNFHKGTHRYTAADGYSGQLITNRKPLFIRDVAANQAIRPHLDRERFPIRSYLGLPLMVGQELVGTIELASLNPDAFEENHLEILKILSGQAAIALKNALAHEEEERRVAELSGLASLAAAVGGLNDVRDLFANLAQNIQPLAGTHILGFMLYDETQNKLIGQAPFIGLPDKFVEWYQLELPPNSAGEKVWLENSIIVSNQPDEDPKLQILGITGLLVAASIKNTIMVPLLLRGRSLGYLQAANKKDGSDFSEEDIQLLSIISGQVAPLIDNARLVQESRRRTQQAETLRRIASLISSPASIDEVLGFSLVEIGRYLAADIAAVFLIAQDYGALELHEPSLFGTRVEQIRALQTIPTEDPSFRETATSTLRICAAGIAGYPNNLPGIYKPLMRISGLNSAIIAPIILRDRGVGEILVGQRKAEYFTRADIEVVSSTAGQFAILLERTSAAPQSDARLFRRVEELTALARISRELNATSDIQQLLELTYNEILYNTSADGGSIAMVQPAPVLSRQQGEKQDISFLVVNQIGSTPGASLAAVEQEALTNSSPILINDYSTSNYPAPMPNVGTSLVIPLKYDNAPIGVIHLQAKTPGRFDNDALETAQTIAAQAALALGNASRYQEQTRQAQQIKRGVNELSNLLTSKIVLGNGRPLENILQQIASSIQTASGFERVMISLFDEKTQTFKRIAAAGMAKETLDTNPAGLSFKSLEALLKPEFKHGKAYFIPESNLPEALPGDVHIIRSEPGKALDQYFRWQPNDLLLIPLYGDENPKTPLGFISVDAPQNGLRPNPDILETLGLFSSQTAITIAGHKQVAELKQTVGSLQSEIGRVQNAREQTQRQLPVLLRKDLDQAIALQKINTKSQRVYAGLAVLEQVALHKTREKMLLTLGRELHTRMGFEYVLTAENTARGPVLMEVLGSIPENVNVEALIGQRNPLRTTLRTGELSLNANLEIIPAATQTASQMSPLLSALGTIGFVCLPIMNTHTLKVDGEDNRVNAAILAISREPMPDFTVEDQEIFSLMSRQVSQMLDNLAEQAETQRRLREVNLLLDFGRQLNSLEAGEILTTLVDSALQVATAAHAAMVAIWDRDIEKLVPQAATGYFNNPKILDIRYNPGEGIVGKALLDGTPNLVSEVNLARDYNLRAENIKKYQEALGTFVPISSMILPMKAGDNILGILVLDNFYTTGAFSEEDLLLIGSLTQQAGLILENTRLLQAADQRAAQLQALTLVATTITSNLSEDVLIASLLDQLSTVLVYDTGTLWLRNDDRIAVRAAQGFGDEEERVGLTVNIEDSRLLSEMIDSGRPIYVTDTIQDSRFFQFEDDGTSKRSWLGIPLISKGEVIGVIALEKSEPDFYSAEVIQAGTTFAGQAAVALENARLFEESKRQTQEINERAQRLTLLNQLSNEFGGTLNLDSLLQNSMESLFQAMDAARVSVLLFDEHAVTLRAEIPQFPDSLPVEVPQTNLFGHLRETRGIFITEKVGEEPLLAGLHDFIEERETKSILALPLATSSNFHGILLIHGSGARFSGSEIELATTISNQAAVAIENARLFEKTQLTLEDLALRERYQKGVAQSIVALTESGVSSLPDMLRFTGEAAQCSRAFYFETLENEDGPFWRFVAEWTDYELPGMGEIALWQYIPTREMADWAMRLTTEGNVNGLTSDMPAPVRSRLEAIGIRSFSILAVPSPTVIPGFLGLADDTFDRIWQANEQDALQTLAAALATNLAEEALLRQVQASLAVSEEQTRRLSLLNEMSNRMSRADGLFEILDIACEISREVLNADLVAVTLKDPDEQTMTLVSLHGISEGLKVGRRIPLAGSPMENAIRQNKVVVSHGIDPLTRMRSTVITPLNTRDLTLGTLNAGSKFPNAFGIAEQTILMQIASLVAANIDNKQLIEETRRLTEELEQRVVERTQALEEEHQRTQILLQIITELSGSLDIDIVLNRTLSLINDIVRAEQSTIMLTQPDSPALIQRASLGYTQAPQTGGQPTNILVSEGLAGWVITNRQAALVNNLEEDSRWVKKNNQRYDHKSAMAVPLMVGEDALGALLLFHRETNMFTEDQLDLVQATAKQIAVAINNAQLFLLIRDQAENLGVMMRNQQVEANRLRAILEAVADGVLVTSSDGKISIFNASAESILGIAANKTIGKSLDSFVGLFGRAGQKWLQTIQQWSNNPASHESGETFSERITLENGRYVAVNLAAVIWRNEFLGTVSIFRDITALVEVDRLKSEFVANVSHELRTPMTSIKGYVDILLMGAAGPLTEMAQGFLGIVKSNAERLNMLVNDLLDVSRIEAGRATFSMQPVNLNDTILRVLTEMRTRSEQENRPMEFIYEPNPSLPRVVADPERLTQVIENLVENGYTYTPDNGKVEVRAFSVENMIQVDVQDNGIGIAPEYHDQIFQRFFRGEDPLVLASAGTGLGLPIVQFLVETHGGTIWFESKGVRGKGSIFSFTIPIYQVEEKK